MARQITCPRCRRTLDVPDDAPARGLSCPRCLAPLPDRGSTGIQTASAARPAASPSGQAAEEFVHQGQRDGTLGAIAAPGLVGLIVFGIVLVQKSTESYLPLFGMLDLAMVAILSVLIARRGRVNVVPGCVIALCILLVVGAGGVFFFVVCARVFFGPFH